jgi:hypothetical protein
MTDLSFRQADPGNEVSVKAGMAHLDVYRIHLVRSERLSLQLSAAIGGTTLTLWKPGTTHVQAAPRTLRQQRLVESSTPLPHKQLAYQATRAGWYYLETALTTPTNATYTLSYATSAP